MPMSKRITCGHRLKSATTKSANPKGIPIASWVSNAPPTKSSLMARGIAEKEYLWGYGFGVASATVPRYGDVVVAESTLPFNENDITYFVPLYIRTVATLGFFPTHIPADAAFDAWSTYHMVAYRRGLAAIPLNRHGHPTSYPAPDGGPRRAKG